MQRYVDPPKRFPNGEFRRASNELASACKQKAADDLFVYVLGTVSRNRSQDNSVNV